MALLKLLFADTFWGKGWLAGRPGLAALLGALWLGLLSGPGRAQAQQRTDSVRVVPQPPVLNRSLDRTAPVAPPPPGVRNTGQPAVAGASRQPAPAIADTSRRVRDSLNVAVLRRRSQVETTVKYKAQDSIQFDIPSKTARLYNKAAVDYGQMALKAGLITVNYGTNTVQAAGRRDTVKHQLEQTPVFKDAQGSYEAGRVAYNFKTQKGKISDVVTQQGEGYVHADNVKKLPNNDFFGQRGTYTTCNLAHPHFYIESRKMKVIPGEKVITGPFNMVVADIPLPIGLPFGYFPTPKGGRGSGIIIPTFGQGAQRGFSLQNGGYYWAPNDYIGVRLTGDLYAGAGDRFGGWGATAEISYTKRYKYSGNFNFTYSNAPTSALTTATTVTGSEYPYATAVNTFWVTWSHSPKPLPGGGVFSASVQAGSSSYNRINTLNTRQRLSAAFNSSISYSKTLRRLPVNFSIQAAQTQNVQTGEMTFTLPNFSVGLARQYPYQWLGLEPRGRWYEQFAVTYTMVGQNRISNQVPATTLSNGLPLLGGNSTAYVLPVSFSRSDLGRLLNNAQNGLQHQLQLTLPSFALLGRHIQVQPSVQYGETWYSKSLFYKYQNRARAIEVDTINGFARAYSVSASVSANTSFYGTLRFKNTHFVQAIRHKVSPSLSYSFSPDLSRSGAYLAYDPSTGFESQVSDALYGVRRRSNQVLDPRAFSRYQGFAYGSTASARVSQISFAVQNSLEMKVRNAQDTTGNQPTKKVSLADGLDLAVSYNFASPGDSLHLSPLSLGYRVQVAKKLQITFTSTFDFYQHDSTGRTLRHYLLEQEGNRRLARLSSAALSLGYQFNPAARPTRKSNIPRATAPSNDPVLGTVAPQAIYADYIDFDIPWEASVSYTAAYNTMSPQQVYQLMRSGQYYLLSGNSATVSGSVKLTPNLRFSTTLNYNFTQNTLDYPQVQFYRDLHCWQIAGTWVPVGPLRGYFFTLSAKSSLLQDLKVTRNKTILNR